MQIALQDRDIILLLSEDIEFDQDFNRDDLNSLLELTLEIKGGVRWFKSIRRVERKI